MDRNYLTCMMLCSMYSGMFMAYQRLNPPVAYLPKTNHFREIRTIDDNINREHKYVPRNRIVRRMM